MGFWDSVLKKKSVEDLPNFTHEDLDLPPPPPPNQEMLAQDRQFMHDEGLDKPFSSIKQQPSMQMVSTPPKLDMPPIGVMPAQARFGVEQKPQNVKENQPSPHVPAFVRVDQIDAMVESTGAVKTSIRRIEESCQRMQEVRAEQEKVMEKWKHQLEDAQRKLVYIDRTLFKTVG